MTVELLDDVDALEACVGTRPAGSHLKSITYLDEHCQTLLAASPFAVLTAVAGDGTLRTVTLGGDPGVLAPSGRAEVSLPDLAGLDVPDGAACGILSFVPDYRETLRLNGRLRTGSDPTLQLEEAFLHCAKALIRSRLWDEHDATPIEDLADGPADLGAPAIAAFFAASPFVVLSSVDDDGEADVSPKGDPPGMVAQVVDGRTLAIADRPGNRRTDTMHNLVANDRIGLLAFIPGLDNIVEVRGRAGVTADPGILEGLAVKGKVPTAAVVITVEQVEARREDGIGRAHLWETDRHVDPDALPKSTRIWVDHVKRNEDPGFAAKTARKLANTKMLEKGISKDYRDNLY